MVVVDTSVWSLFLRRCVGTDSPALTRFKEHLAADAVLLLGIIRQEVLSGLRDATQFRRINSILEGFDQVCATPDDHQRAAEFYNMCRVRGIQGAAVDFLIGAMAERRSLPILTTDSDFVRYSQHLPITLDLY